MLTEKERKAVDNAVENGPDALRFLLGSYEYRTGDPVTTAMSGYHAEKTIEIDETCRRNMDRHVIDPSIRRGGWYDQIIRRGD